ncbi:MAG: hypothetical protein ABJG88_04495 [Litorimonas sp.]
MTQVSQVDFDASQSEAVSVENVDPALKWLGIFACFSVAWGVLSLITFTLSLTMDVNSVNHLYSPEQIEYLMQTPFWAGVGKGFAAGGLFIGSVYLLLRKQSAYYWLMWSLTGSLLILVDTVFRGGFQILSGMETGVNLISIVVGMFIFWVTYRAMLDGQLQPE